MFGPKKSKFRKAHRDRSCTEGIATRGFRPSFGTFALKSIEGGEITARQIEAARRVISREIKRGGKIWIRIFPHKPITRKAAEVPMGSGKGSLDHYVAVIKKGTIIFEMDGVTTELAKNAMHLASHKLPVKCKFIDTNNLI